jgi:hypothetical protein
MRYQTVVCMISLCATIFFAGCKERPWGDCGPAGLSKSVPLGVTIALESALSPGGMITLLTTKDGANDTLICDDNQSTTYGPAYLSGSFKKDVSSASSENIFEFQDNYRVNLYCHGQEPMGNARIGKMFGVWLVYAVGTGYEPLAALEAYLGPDFSDCTRGLISSYEPGLGFVIITDKQGITRFYPLHVDNPIWENTQNKELGEFSLTKDEFFEWYHTNIDLLQSNASL